MVAADIIVTSAVRRASCEKHQRCCPTAYSIPACLHGTVQPFGDGMQGTHRLRPAARIDATAICNWLGWDKPSLGQQTSRMLGCLAVDCRPDCAPTGSSRDAVVRSIDRCWQSGPWHWGLLLEDLLFSRLISNQDASHNLQPSLGLFPAAGGCTPRDCKT